ncbi:MAG: polysaccharide biosynthesis/export family protein, partial [Thermoanaerobaculia bacterium]|nr:polysaccharide biosynthesis/export family protein [Thermoanaerobaculia bacterium]
LGLAALLLALPLPARAQPDSAYRLGPRDVIAIEVAEDPSLATESEVAPDGRVRMPILGPVDVAGLTAEGAARRIQGVLEESLLQRATVTVEIRQYLSSPISVTGAVANPGPINSSGRIPLSAALREAGGVTESHGGEVRIVRQAGNGLSDELTLDLEPILNATDPSLDVPVFSGDRILVPVASDVTVLFIGEVGAPGTVTLKSTERVTLLYAVARAGGLTERASRKIRIKRTGPDGKQVEMRVDYKAILEGEIPDPELRDGDLILVKEAFF